jgi:mono/diheme cytochrome c family protein
MKTAFIISLFLIAGMATDPWEAPKSADNLKNPRSGDAKAASEGEDLYLSYCWSCHGDDADGKGPASANIDTPPANLTTKQVQQQTDGAIFWKIGNGRNDMAPYQDVLTEQQRWALVNYIRTLSKP